VAASSTPGYDVLDVNWGIAKKTAAEHGHVVDAPGLYALGLPMLRRRRSSFINGIEDDARAVIGHLAAELR